MATTWETRHRTDPADRWLPLAAAAAALLGRLPALGAWWNADDWELLAGAAGLRHVAGPPARWLSRHLYWDLMWPVAGLDPHPWAWTRLLLFALCAGLTVRIGRLLRLPAAAALAAGLLVAASPLAFTPLRWAAGVQELLGLALLLVAVERLLAGGRLAVAAAILAGGAAILSKESALLLPAGLLATSRLADGAAARRARLAGLLLLPVAIAEGWLLWRGFDHGPSGEFALSLAAVPVNLAQHGWWLASPGPVLTTRFTFAIGLAGLSVWLLWSAWAWRRWQVADRLPALLLGAALLILAPALPLQTRVAPWLALAAVVPAALALSGAIVPALVPTRPQRQWIVLAAATVALLTWMGMTVRIQRRAPDGTPADPLVRRAAVAHAAAAALRSVPPGQAPRVTLLQIDFRRDAADADLPRPTFLHEALGGRWGPALLAAPGQEIRWTTDLGSVPPEAIVFADGGARLLFWGPPAQAWVYLALTAIAADRPLLAADALERGLRQGRRTFPFGFAADQLPVPVSAVRRRAASFLQVLAASSRPADERSALLETARQLLRVCDALPPDAPAGDDEEAGGDTTGVDRQGDVD